MGEGVFFGRGTSEVVGWRGSLGGKDIRDSLAQYARNVQLASLKEQVAQVAQHKTWLEQQITYLSVVSADADGPISLVREEVVKRQAQLRDLVRQLFRHIHV